MLDVGLGSVAGDEGERAVLRNRVNNLSAAHIGICPHVHVGLNRGHWGGAQVGYRVDAVEDMIAQERHEQVWVGRQLAVQRCVGELVERVVARGEEGDALCAVQDVENDLLRGEPGVEAPQGRTLGRQDIFKGLGARDPGDCQREEVFPPHDRRGSLSNSGKTGCREERGRGPRPILTQTNS